MSKLARKRQGHFASGHRSNEMVTEHEARATVASMNLEAQHQLFTMLNAAVRASGQTPEEVADRLGVETYVVHEILDGDRDMTLTEIRHFAFSVDACVTYRVTPRMTSTLVAMSKAVTQISNVVWLPSDDFVTSEERDHGFGWKRAADLATL